MSVSRNHAPLRKDTAVFLRNAIVGGTFKPNQRLKERELCEFCGVSRTTIREALRELEAQGFVKNLFNKGPIVAPITHKEVEDTYQLRQVLEALACRVFAEKADDAEVQALQDATDQFGNACCAGAQRDDMIQAKNRFYEILLNGCGNALVTKILGNLHHRISFLRMATLSHPGRCLESYDELRAIMEAIRRRDPDAAWNTCVKHIIRAREVAIDLAEHALNLAPDLVED